VELEVGDGGNGLNFEESRRVITALQVSFGLDNGAHTFLSAYAK
jgi:hypothetical protein